MSENPEWLFVGLDGAAGAFEFGVEVPRLRPRICVVVAKGRDVEYFVVGFGWRWRV